MQSIIMRYRGDATFEGCASRGRWIEERCRCLCLQGDKEGMSVHVVSSQQQRFGSVAVHSSVLFQCRLHQRFKHCAMFMNICYFSRAFCVIEAMINSVGHIGVQIIGWIKITDESLQVRTEGLWNIIVIVMNGQISTLIGLLLQF